MVKNIFNEQQIAQAEAEAVEQFWDHLKARGLVSSVRPSMVYDDYMLRLKDKISAAQAKDHSIPEKRAQSQPALPEGFRKWLDAAVTVASLAGIDDSECLPVWPEVLGRDFFRGYPQLTVGDLRELWEALAAAPSIPENPSPAAKKAWAKFQSMLADDDPAKDHCANCANAGWVPGDVDGEAIRCTECDNADQVETLPTKAAIDVLAERRRQIDVEGRTPEHDDEYPQHSFVLACAGMCYIEYVASASWMLDADGYGEEAYRSGEEVWYWPFKKEFWKPKNPRRDLVRAAALIIAEIERLDRAAVQGGPNGQ